MASASVLNLSSSASSDYLVKDANRKDSDNQWSAILNEVRISTSNRLTEKNVLVLGDRETGKSDLIARLIGKESVSPSGVGLEHVSIPVKDDEREDVTQINAWVLEEEYFASSLMPLVLNEKTLDKTVVWLFINMTKPWNIVQSLEKWSTVLTEELDKLRLDPVLMKNYQQKLEKTFKEYVDPSLAQTTSAATESEVDLPLGENTLTMNLGVPIIVVVSKADHMLTLEKDFDYKEEKFDFIQMHLREWCLKHGAGLIFTSAKENKNIRVLLKYSAHLLYGLKFDEDGFVLDRDSLFIPIGWDNEKKISILNDNLGDIKASQPYDAVVTAPPPLLKQNNAGPTLHAEDDQDFVKRIQQMLQQPIPSRLDSPAGAVKTGSSVRSSPAQGSPKKDGPRGSLGTGGTSESALSSFFNTLLNKNNKGPPTPPTSARTSSPSAIRVDAAAELDRLSRSSDRQPENQTEATEPELPKESLPASEEGSL
ncbi:hypothetical protein RvY_09135 [Ramazzottius varieornatus]|uniref:Dynein light intermediate chain n=1 Tax=Ramazzottius varieornatus TaxID=947166 RepID=A0A1D1VAR9_RAMVA|nr:hypothetical protein RvY_09135 [Ramazzottius varieornatus]